MRNYEKYDINKILHRGIDLKRIALMDYIYCNFDLFTSFQLNGKDYMLFIPRTISDDIEEITTQPDAVLKTLKNLESEGYVHMLSGKFNCTKHGYCRSGVCLTSKFYELLK